MLAVFKEVFVGEFEQVAENEVEFKNTTRAYCHEVVKRLSLRLSCPYPLRETIPEWIHNYVRICFYDYGSKFFVEAGSASVP